MKGFARSRVSAIGLDVGARSVGAVQLRRDRSGLRIAGAMSLARRTAGGGAAMEGPTPEEAGWLMDTLHRRGMEGSRVVLCVPQAKVLTGVFDLPPRSSGAPIEQIAHNELARAHRVEPAEVESAWWETPAGVRETEGTQVIAVGCRHTDGAALVEVFEEAGASVAALDAPGPALARAVRPVCGSGGTAELTGVLALGWDVATLVVSRAGVIVYERCLAEGGLSVAAEALQRKLEVDAETALYLLSEVGLGDGPADLSEEAELLDEARALIGERVDELALEARASASYAGRRYGEPVARMLVAGEGGSIPGLGARLERKLDVPLRVVRLAELVPGSAGTAAERAGPSLVLALGLAQHREAWA